MSNEPSSEATSTARTRGCPDCDGLGRIAAEGFPQGLLCLGCDGTGNREASRIYRAYRLGLRHGEAAVRNATPTHDESLGLLGVMVEVVTEEAERRLEREGTDARPRDPLPNR